MKNFILFALLISILSCKTEPDDNNEDACTLMAVAMDLTLTINFTNPPPNKFLIYINDDLRGGECFSDDKGMNSPFDGAWKSSTIYVAKFDRVFSDEELESENIHIKVESVNDCSDQNGSLIIDETESTLTWSGVYPNGESCPVQNVATTEVNQ